jgi:hypothetical protein
VVYSDLKQRCVPAKYLPENFSRKRLGELTVLESLCIAGVRLSLPEEENKKMLLTKRLGRDYILRSFAGPLVVEYDCDVDWRISGFSYLSGIGGSCVLTPAGKIFLENRTLSLPSIGPNGFRMTSIGNYDFVVRNMKSMRKKVQEDIQKDLDFKALMLLLPKSV